MRATYVPPPSSPHRAREIHGPGDLARERDGSVVLVGAPPPDRDAGGWAIDLGLFALRGGSIAHRPSGAPRPVRP